jgi:hypothetical protein
MYDLTNPYQVTCSTWTVEDTVCRRQSGQPETTAWTVTVRDLNSIVPTATYNASVELRDQGGSRAVQRSTLTCTAH